MIWAPLLVIAGAAAATMTPVARPDVLLITLDTTRADAVGFSGSDDAQTPILDRLAAAGVSYRTAVAPAPLTLPSHTTLLTGADPPEHGVRTNGAEVLSDELPTLASALAGAGWTTAAVVGSRVLDHRFGLDRGFADYDDVMLAERVGEYGYPERDARAVTDAALALLAESGGDVPYFLWVHYYDPHSPYDPPAGFGGAGDRARYLGELSFVDDQLGRLLRALPHGLAGTIVAVAGDHGEALGDHGEDTHGIFLYRATLEVPLVLAGGGLPAGRVIGEPVALRQVAPTILRLAGLPDHEIARREALPLPGDEPGQASAIFAEATLPASAYGWAPLRCVLAGGLKYVDAPRPELYDLAADPGETRNLIDGRPEYAAWLAARLDDVSRYRGSGASGEIDAETRAALAGLGYVTGTTANDGLDPKDGISVLAGLKSATRRLRSGDAGAAAVQLDELVRKNPSNAPLQTRYGEALLAIGEAGPALAAYRAAVELLPHSEFARRNVGDALAALGRVDDARASYSDAIAINPRWAPPWLRLAELAPDADRAAILRRAVAAEVASVTVLLRLAEAELENDPNQALITCGRIGEIAPLAPEGALCVGKAHLALGAPLRAAPHLRRAAVLGHGGPVAAEAEMLLENSTSPP